MKTVELNFPPKMSSSQTLTIESPKWDPSVLSVRNACVKMNQAAAESTISSQDLCCIPSMHCRVTVHVLALFVFVCVFIQAQAQWRHQPARRWRDCQCLCLLSYIHHDVGDIFQSVPRLFRFLNVFPSPSRRPVFLSFSSSTNKKLAGIWNAVQIDMPSFTV